MEKKRCIVTGGAGFIGSHVVEELINLGHDVLVIDNFSTGRPENLAHIKTNDRLTIVENDIVDLKCIAPYFENIDWVFHLAALADIVPSIEHPELYHHSNVNGTLSVLQASQKAKVKRFVYAASSSCYGIPDNYPTSESEAISPQYPYALTKYIGEQYVLHWAQTYKLPACSCRFFNVYGPRSRTSGSYGAVFGVFLKQKLENQPYTIVGDGSQTRDFTFVKDISNAVVEVAKSDYTGEVFNVGSSNTYSVNHLVSLLGGEKTYIPKRPGEPDCTHADVSKIKKMIGWEAKVTLEKGVEIMLENIDYWKNAPLWDPDNIAVATKDWFEYLS